MSLMHKEDFRFKMVLCHGNIYENWDTVKYICAHLNGLFIYTVIFIYGIKYIWLPISGILVYYCWLLDVR